MGELLAGLLDDGEDCAEGWCCCCVTIFLAGAYSLNDLCFLVLVALPALWEKLSRYDLFLLLENIVAWVWY